MGNGTRPDPLAHLRLTVHLPCLPHMPHRPFLHRLAHFSDLPQLTRLPPPLEAGGPSGPSGARGAGGASAAQVVQVAIYSKWAKCPGWPALTYWPTPLGQVGKWGKSPTIELPSAPPVTIYLFWLVDLWCFCSLLRLASNCTPGLELIILEALGKLWTLTAVAES